MSKKTSRLAAVAIAGIAAVAMVGSATVASAFPNKTSACTGCHSRDTRVVVTATQTANDGVNATYSVLVSNPWYDGVTGFAVFDGAANIRNGYDAATVSVPVGKTYTFWGVAGSGGAGSNSISVSPVAPPPPADTTAPVVVITSPTNGATVLGNVALTANATDAGGVARVDFKVDGVTVSTDAVAPYTGLWDATLAAPGSHKIEAVAVDAAGNSGTASLFVSIASPPPPPVDDVAPLVAITSPANGATVSGTVALAANASDAMSGVARVEFRVDGALVGTDATAPYAASWNAAAAAPGSHAIQVVAYDNAGLSASTSIQVSIASPPPPPPVVVQNSDLTVSVVTAAGTPVGGAKVIVKNTATGVRYVRITSSAGTVSLLDLPLGTYSVDASGRGYRRAAATVVADSPTELVALTLVRRR